MKEKKENKKEKRKTLKSHNSLTHYNTVTIYNHCPSNAVIYISMTMYNCCVAWYFNVIVCLSSLKSSPKYYLQEHAEFFLPENVEIPSLGTYVWAYLIYIFCFQYYTCNISKRHFDFQVTITLP